MMLSSKRADSTTLCGSTTSTMADPGTTRSPTFSARATTTPSMGARMVDFSNWAALASAAAAAEASAAWAWAIAASARAMSARACSLVISAASSADWVVAPVAISVFCRSSTRRALARAASALRRSASASSTAFTAALWEATAAVCCALRSSAASSATTSPALTSSPISTRTWVSTPWMLALTRALWMASRVPGPRSSRSKAPGTTRISSAGRGSM